MLNIKSKCKIRSIPKNYEHRMKQKVKYELF